MTESELVENTKPGKKPRRVCYLKMKVIDGLQKSTINEHVKNLAADTTKIDTEGSNSYVDLKDFVPKHNSQVIPTEKMVIYCRGYISLSAMANGKSSILFTTSNLNSSRSILTSSATNLTDDSSARRFSTDCLWPA
jgi:hypothetical protein